MAFEKSKKNSLYGPGPLSPGTINYPCNSNLLHVYHEISCTCMKEIEKLRRNFVWGHDNNQRRIHFVRWSTITQPIVRGGHGIRCLSLFNDALLAKLGSRFLSQPKALWTRFLKGEYHERQVGHFLLKTSSNDLWLLKSIAKAWSGVCKCCYLESWS